MSKQLISVRPSVFEYTNYRVFLRDLHAHLKSEMPRGFSFRAFSKAAGFTSPNFLKLVIDGKRGLSSASIESFARALKLPRDEARFFRNLVLLNQAKTADEKETLSRQLFRSRRFRAAQPLKQAQFNYYSHWYLVPIRELVAAPGFREDAAWIAAALSPAITEAEAQNALDELIALGLLRREGDRLVQVDATVTTGDEVVSGALAQFHREMMKKGAESIERFPGAERDISSVTLGLSRENALRVKKLIQRFRKQLLEISLEPQTVEGVFQVNSQFFPLTERL